MFDSRVEAIEFIVEENSRVSGIPIKDLKLKKMFLYHLSIMMDISLSLQVMMR